MSLNVLSDDQIKVSLHSIGSITPAGLMPVDVNFIAEKGKAKVEVAVINIGSLELTPAKASVLVTILLAILMTPYGNRMLVYKRPGY